MNRDDAKQILLRYRPDTGDATDPEMAEALALANTDADLARWLAEHSARQKKLRDKFRQVVAPAGLMEQIVSEQAAARRATLIRRRFTQIAVATAAAVITVLLGLFWLNQGAATDDTLAIFQKQMTGYALRGYAMDLPTNDQTQIRAYLKQQHSPADYTLSRSLQQATPAGCAVESWQSSRVSMVCFRTGKPLPPGTQSDLWLFVADRSSVSDAPADSTPQISRVNRLVLATWTENGKVYLLGTTADESVLRKFL